jgi:hypothetical protein
MELGLTSADSCHEVSVHPTLCDEFLEMECRLLWSELANVVGSLRHQSLPCVVIQIKHGHASVV